mgnify:CR=1 FL=1
MQRLVTDLAADRDWAALRAGKAFHRWTMLSTATLGPGLSLLSDPALVLVEIMSGWKRWEIGPLTCMADHTNTAASWQAIWFIDGSLVLCKRSVVLILSARRVPAVALATRFSALWTWRLPPGQGSASCVLSLKAEAAPGVGNNYPLIISLADTWKKTILF